jgi:hypothetical protein
MVDHLPGAVPDHHYKWSPLWRYSACSLFGFYVMLVLDEKKDTSY